MATTVNINQSPSSKLLEDALAQFPNIMAQYRAIQQGKVSEQRQLEAMELDKQRFEERKAQNIVTQQNYEATSKAEQENWQSSFDLRKNAYDTEKLNIKHQRLMTNYLEETTSGYNIAALNDPTKFGRDTEEFLADGVTPNPYHNLSPAFGGELSGNFAGFEEYKKLVNALDPTLPVNYQDWLNYKITKDKSFTGQQVLILNNLKKQMKLNTKLDTEAWGIVDGTKLDDNQINKVMNAKYNAQVVYNNMGKIWPSLDVASAEGVWMDYTPVKEDSKDKVKIDDKDKGILDKIIDEVKGLGRDELTGEFEFGIKEGVVSVALAAAAWKSPKLMCWLLNKFKNDRKSL